MKRILLSGFGVFGDYRSNLSQTIAKKLDGKVICGHRVKSLIFSAQISRQNRGELIFEVAGSFGASGIISLGIASEKRGLCLETRVRNLIKNEKYCSRELSGTPVDPARTIGERLYMHISQWEIMAWLERCRAANLTTQVSDDCGGFCCNQLAYQARVVQAGESVWKNIPFICFHIPCSAEDVPDRKLFAEIGKVTMTAESVITGLEILLAEAKL